MPSQSRAYSYSQLNNDGGPPSGPVVVQPLRRINDDGSTASTRAILIQPFGLVEGNGRHPGTSGSRHNTASRTTSTHTSSTHRSHAPSSSSSRTVVPSTRHSNILPTHVSDRGMSLGTDWNGPGQTGSRALSRIAEETTGSSHPSHTRRASQSNMALVPYSRGSELRRSGTVAGTSSARASQLALTRAPSASRTVGRSMMPPSSRRLGPVGADSSSTEIEIRIRRSNGGTGSSGGDHVQVRISKS
jgi:hypothetical protein